MIMSIPVTELFQFLYFIFIFTKYIKDLSFDLCENYARTTTHIRFAMLQLPGSMQDIYLTCTAQSSTLQGKHSAYYGLC